MDLARLVVALSLLLVFCLFEGCSRKCERLSSAASTSPDGTWVASAHADGCGGGFGTGYISNTVDLRRSNDSGEPMTVLAPEGQWEPTTLAQLRWIDSTRLEIHVPNRTWLPLYVASFQGVDVEVRYDHDNPADRASWLSWRKQNEKWVADTVKNGHAAAPQPTPPPLPEH